MLKEKDTIPGEQKWRVWSATTKELEFARVRKNLDLDVQGACDAKRTVATHTFDFSRLKLKLLDFSRYVIKTGVIFLLLLDFVSFRF